MRPVSGSIKWADIESLFKGLGAKIKEREGSRIGVILFGEVQVFHRPHPSPDTDKGAVSSIRKGVGKKWSETMMNMMSIDGYKAIIQYDPVLDKFRGEFIGLNGGADFYATNIEELKKEGKISLKVFLALCEEEGINPSKEYSGKFSLRVPPALHAEIAARAAAEGKSLNKCVTDLLGEAIHN